MFDWYNIWINKEPDRYYAYIYGDGIVEPIGEIYYYLEDNIHLMGILISDKYRWYGYAHPALLELEKVAFEKNKISELVDMIPIDREKAIKLFEKVGFIVSDKEIKKYYFGKERIVKELLITKDMYDNNGWYEVIQWKIYQQEI